MTTPSMDDKTLAFLIELLRDDSETVVRTAVRHLLGLGPSLRERLAGLPAETRRSWPEPLKNVMKSYHRSWLREVWTDVLSAADETDRLETGLAYVGRYLNGWDSGDQPDVPALWQRAADDFRKSGRRMDPFQLAEFLFKDWGLRGDEDDYYHPQNSNPAAVLKRGRANPLTLCCWFQAVGRRCGFHIQGYPYPGHFLARFEDRGVGFLVDCFHGGKIFREKDLRLVMVSSEGVVEPLSSALDSRAILQRMCANLIRSFHLQGEEAEQRLFMDLFDGLEAGSSGEGVEDGLKEPVKLFSPGEVVVHRRYGYKGLIVEGDDVCRASALWYFSNATQPPRRQPWYHVLVHGTVHVTYAAESHLRRWEGACEIDHPLVDVFFDKDDAGLYHRNDRPWPQTI